MKNAQLTGGQILVKSLEDHNVDTAFGVAGESYLAALDALYDSDIHFITNRQEGGACFMAEAYAKLTGKTGICFVTRGPGATNGAIGVHTAKQDSTPLIYLIGQVARDQEGREAFQEIDYRQMFKPPIAKAVFQIEKASDVASIMAEAFKISQEGRKGPVVVSLPEDMLCEDAPYTRAVPSKVAPIDIDTTNIIDVLKNAKNPVAIIGGSGWSEASIKKFQDFALAHHLPVATTFRRQDLFDNDHHCYIGELGTGANPKLVAAIRDTADVILAVNTRLSEMASQGYTLLNIPKPRQKLIHIYAEQSELGKVYTPDIGLCASANDFVDGLGAGRGAGNHKDWCHAMRDEYEGWTTINKEQSEFDVDMDLIFKHIRDRAPKDTIYTTDAGNFSGWAQRYLKYGNGARLLAPTSGAMGYGVPSAISASLVEPKRVVIGMMGDGGFMMSGQELATAMAEKAKPIILLFNNGIYGTIRMHQQRDYPDRHIATDLCNPDFTALAKSYGANAFRVDKSEDFYAAFDHALKSDALTLIEVANSPEQIATTKKMSDL